MVSFTQHTLLSPVATSAMAQQGPQLFWKSIMATTKVTELSISTGCWKPLCILQAACLWLVGWSRWFLPTDLTAFLLLFTGAGHQPGHPGTAEPCWSEAGHATSLQPAQPLPCQSLAPDWPARTWHLPTQPLQQCHGDHPCRGTADPEHLSHEEHTAAAKAEFSISVQRLDLGQKPAKAWRKQSGRGLLLPHYVSSESRNGGGMPH